MILIIFIIAIIFSSVLLIMGLRGSFGLAYLSMFSFLLLGLFLMNSGLDIESGIREDPIGSHNFVTVYETYTAANEPVINVISNTFIFLPFIGLLLSTFIALRGR